MEGTRSNKFLDRGNGVVLMILAVFGLVATLTVVRPQRPSPFAAGTGYGVGFGSDSIMLTRHHLGTSR
jgi:hypothetical protein